jgi:hypothetical protein
MRELRARTMLAVATTNGHRPTARELAPFERQVEKLRDEHAPWADALAELLRAGGLAALGDERAALAFAGAATRFDDAGMALHAAVARARAPGAGNSGLRGLTSRGVAAPDRLVAMLSPGGK